MKRKQFSSEKEMKLFLNGMESTCYNVRITRIDGNRVYCVEYVEKRY